ncbi:MAG: hypothetical protein KGI26_05075 [Thaumarchaeota archaeon]|nr:hypothetical protein [Nitrososphaerota archaeon]
MQVPELERCRDCSHPLLDVQEELVCPGCGLVKEKSVMEMPRGTTRLPLYGKLPLGSYMGAKRNANRDGNLRVPGEDSSYRRMKRLSDHVVREGSYVDCGRLIERVGERLFLPRVAILQAASLARSIMGSPHRRLTVAEVSAYALVAACKIEGVTSVSIREILGAYADLGKRVSSSAIFRLTIDSPVRTYARRPEDYVPRVVAKLSTNKRLAARLARAGAMEAPYLESLRLMACEILERCEETALGGKRPCALAASAVYSAETVIAAMEGRSLVITQRECAECGDAAEYTVREQCSTVFAEPVRALKSRPCTSPALRIAR